MWFRERPRVMVERVDLRNFAHVGFESAGPKMGGVSWGGFKLIGLCLLRLPPASGHN